jgi:putative Mg2+ transporter-C (MgtC) family protein
MPLTPTPTDIALRLLLTVVACLLIGFNRSERGRAAGVRTVTLVGLTSCLALVLANLLLTTRGKPSDSFVQLDMMRLPLGVLTGIGFIGAGAIGRRNEMVRGVTTAATLWFVTMLGMCFGAGQLGLGSVGTVIGLAVLWALKWIEDAIAQEQHATLTVWFDTESGDAEPEADLRGELAKTTYRVNSTAVSLEDAGRRRCVKWMVFWRSREGSAVPPALLQQWARRPTVSRLHWEPAGLKMGDEEK